MTDLQKQYTDKLKQVELAKAGLDVDSTKDYVKYITADDKKEIEQQAVEVAADAGGKRKAYADTKVDKTGVWRPFD